MEINQDTIIILLPYVYALVSEIIGVSGLEDNSVIQAIWRIIKKVSKLVVKNQKEG